MYLNYERIRQSINCSQEVNEGQVHKWKQMLALAGESVDHTNQCFGLILFISVTYSFVYFITNSFYLVNSFSRTNQSDVMFTIVHVLYQFAMLWLILYVPSKVTNSVSCSFT